MLRTTALGAALVAGLLLAPAAPLESAGARATTLPAADTFAVDGVHSSILFRCGHLGVSYQWGRFNSFTGEFVLDEDPAKSHVSIEVEAASVDTGNGGRDDHLRGPDYFDAKQFPKMTFRSTAVAKGEGDAYAITGDLELHGVKKSITFDVQKVGEGDFDKFGYRAGFTGSFTIDRFDFGIESSGETLGHDVEMTFSIEGIRG